MQFKIKNWKIFQHFKDRRPPWIKLHRDILDKSDIMTLSPDNFRFLVCMWLLASEDKTLEGMLPSVDDIAFRMRPMTKSNVLKRLKDIDKFLIRDDISAISTQYQPGPPETETETETKTKDKADKSADSVKHYYTDDFLTFWESYPKKVAKRTAAKAFVLAKRRGADLNNLLVAIAAQKLSDKWLQGYVPNPATWLNGDCWEDEDRQRGQGYRELLQEFEEEENGLG